MSEVDLLFEVSEESKVGAQVEDLNQRLGQLSGVEEVEVFREPPLRTVGVDIVAAIGVTITVVKGSRELVAQIRKLIQEISALLKDGRELKQAWVSVGKLRKPIDQLTDADYEELSKG